MRHIRLCINRNDNCYLDGDDGYCDCHEREPTLCWCKDYYSGKVYSTKDIYTRSDMKRELRVTVYWVFIIAVLLAGFIAYLYILR